MKKIKKIFASLLALAMAVTMVPMTAFADGTVGSSDVVTDKTAVLEDDGTYTINLSAYATGATTTTTITEKSGVPLDIVMVIDQSGSMHPNYIQPLKDAVTSFVNTIYENGQEYNVDHRIAMVGYASNKTDGKSDKSDNSRVNGRTDAWINTGLFVNGDFRNYEKQVRTYNNPANVNYSDVVGSSSYYYKDSDQYYQVTCSRSGYYNNYKYTITYEKNGSTVTLVDNKSNDKIALCTVKSTTNSALTDQDYKDCLVSVADGDSLNAGLTANIANFRGSGGTRTSYGMEMAHQVFANNAVESGRQRIVVLFTDGKPGTGNDVDTTEANAAITNAKTIKSTDNAKIYSVGLYSNADSDVTNFMNAVSSNYPNATKLNNRGTQADTKYYATTANASELNNIFTNISKDVTESESSSTITLGDDSVLKDVMANGLVMTDASTVTVKTYAGTTTDGKTVNKGAETDTAKTLTATKVDDVTATVTGFDYSKKYIAAGHPGEMIEVKITGVIPTDESVKNEIMDTNDQALTGIFDKDEKIAATFPQPKTILKDKAYVVDYAKSFNMSTADVSIPNGKVYGDFSQGTVKAQYGNVSGMTYTPKTMNWDGYDKFYVFGNTDDATIKSASANANGNVWGRMTVVPANNVYYDDDFITSESTGTTGIEYTGDWTEVKASAETTESPEGVKDSVQGWIDALDGSAADSNGSIHSIDAASNFNSSKASFTFSGTGFDIYGRTSKATGTVMVNVKGNGISQTKIIDTISESSGDGCYYQIPTCSFSGLERGRYDVTVYVTAAAKDRLTFYMDGIRIYNPVAEDDTVQNAYGEDEVAAVFTQVRDALNLNGSVFIDKNKEGIAITSDYETSEYGTYGPKNEVYLAERQSVSFVVAGGGAYYVGMKAPEGTATAEVTNGSAKSEVNVVGTADLYYKITPNERGIIQITNKSKGLLSLTKIKAAGVDAQLLELMDAEPYLAYAAAFDSLEVVPYENEVVEAPVEDTTEVTAPDENVDNVVIENATEEAAPEVTVPTVEKKWIVKLLSKFTKFFR